MLQQATNIPTEFVDHACHARVFLEIQHLLQTLQPIRIDRCDTLASRLDGGARSLCPLYV